jgi:hypothetical protein
VLIFMLKLSNITMETKGEQIFSLVFEMWLKNFLKNKDVGSYIVMMWIVTLAKKMANDATFWNYHGRFSSFDTQMPNNYFIFQNPIQRLKK